MGRPMPICPGCERSIPYDRLDVHERYCGEIWGKRPAGAGAIEMLDRRLQRIEADLERRLAVLDRRRRKQERRGRR